MAAAQKAVAWEPVPPSESDAGWEPVPPAASASSSDDGWEPVPGSGAAIPADVQHARDVDATRTKFNEISANPAAEPEIARDLANTSPALQIEAQTPGTPAIPAAPVDKSTWDKRPDGSTKGNGYLGVLKRPDGGVSTEISVGVNIDGKEMEIPTLVPTLTKPEVDYLLGGGRPTDAIVKKAVDFARGRMAAGKPVFAGDNEAAAQPRRPTILTPPVAAPAAPQGPGLLARAIAAGEAKPPPFSKAPPRDLTAADTVPGFAFGDFIPGAIESQLGGLWNMGNQAYTAIPALIAAAATGTHKGEGDFIDRFKELHGAMAEPGNYKMQTATGEHVEQKLGDLTEGALDWLGDKMATQFGPEVGAYAKGAAAALASVAGMGVVKARMAPAKGAGPRVEPRMGEMPGEIPPAPRVEPTGRTTPDVVADDVNVRAKAMTPEEEAAFDAANPETEPAMGAMPELPPAPRTDPTGITKPRIRVPAEEVRGREYMPDELPSAPVEPVTPPRSILNAAENDYGPAATSETAAPGARVPDATMDTPVDPTLFHVEPAESAPQARAPKPLEPDEPAAPTPEPRMPEAPREPEKVPFEPDDSYQPAVPEDEYTAMRTITSETRHPETGEPLPRVPQVLQWKGETGLLDRALFDAGAQFKLKSDKPKVREDAARNQAAAFDRLQTEVRARANDPARRATVRDFLTEDGSQVDRAKLQAAASEYRVKVDTMMKDARAAAPGQGTSIVVPARKASAAKAAEAPKKSSLYSPEQNEALAAARKVYDDEVAFVKRNRNGEAEVQKGLKGAAMKYAAEKRKITGELTGKEAAAAETRRRTINYKDKPVTVNGRDGKVESVAFGKVRVKLDDGTTVRVDPADVISRDKGPGTLSANPFADPETLRKLGGLWGKANKGMQRALNPVQAMPDHVGPAAAIGYEAARSLYRAREMSQLDRISAPDQPGIAKDFQQAVAEARAVDPKYDPGEIKTIGDAIRATERARIRAAERKMQADLIASGYAVKPVRGEPLPEGYVIPQNYSAFTLPDGRVLALQKDAAPVLEQMVSGYDYAAERRYYGTPGGKVEALSHGLTGSLLLLPTFHMITAGGRMAPAAINFPKNSMLRYGKSAVKAMNDRAELQDMMKHGVTFFPKRGTFDPEGAHVGAIESRMKQMGLGGVYNGYQWLHNRVLADAVNWGETMYYQWRLEALKAKHKGEMTPADLETYKFMAGRDASLIAANLAKEESGRGWSRILGTLAFSRGLQVNTIRMATRALEGDRVLQAVAQRNGLTVAQAKSVMNKNRKFLATQMVKDYVVMQVTANVLNYFTTSMDEEPNGKKGGHFTWENQGSDKMQMVLPTNVYVGSKKQKDGTRNGVYMSTPFRSTRDVIEYAMIPYELANGEKSSVLRNKASVPVKLAIEHGLTGEDFAGRSLGTGSAALANIAGSLTPSPFEEIPRYGIEAARLGSPTYFSEGLKKVFDPATFGLKVAGMQPKTLKPDPETTMLQGKQIQAEEAIRARASRLKAQLYGMPQEMRELAIKSIEEDGQKAGMAQRDINAITKSMGRAEVSKSAGKSAERYLEAHPSERKTPNIPMLPEAPRAPGEI